MTAPAGWPQLRYS